MKLCLRILILPLLLVGFSCTRDPEVLKQKYLESGNKYFERGKYKEASLMYRNALKRAPNFGEAYYRLALVELKLQNVQGAYAALLRAVELLPTNADARIQLGELYLTHYVRMTGDTPRSQERDYALAELSKLVEDLERLAPKSYDTLRLKGSLLILQSREEPDRAKAQQQFADAFNLFQEANRVKPHQPQMVITLARYLQSQGRGTEAESMVREMIARDPSVASGYQYLYLLYVTQNRMSEAEALWRDAVQKNPKSLDFRISLAGHYRMMKQPDQAKTVIDGMVRDAEDKGDAHYRAGAFYARNREWDAAKHHLEEGMKIPGKHRKEADFRKAIAEVYAARGEYSEATSVIEDLLKDFPNDQNARALHASLLMVDPKPERINAAISDLETAVAADKGKAKDFQNPALRYNLGQAYLRRYHQTRSRADMERARFQFQEAAALVRKDVPLYYRTQLALASANLDLGEFGAAETEARKVLESLAGRPSGFGTRYLLGAKLILGRSQLQRAIASTATGQKPDLSQARATLREALQLDPNSSVAVFDLARVDLAEGKTAEAEAALRKLYEKSKGFDELRLLVQALVTQRQEAEALRIVKAELDRNPERRDLRHLMAETAITAGEYDLAAGQLGELIRLSSQAPREVQGKLYLQLAEAYRRKAQALHAKGDQAEGRKATDQAIAWLKKSKETNPADWLPSYHLALIYDAMGLKLQAKDEYEIILRAQPENAIALNNLAYLLADKSMNGDLDRALAMVSKARQKAPNNVSIADTLGWIYIRKQLSDNAIAIYRELVAKQPGNPTFHLRLGMALEQKGEKAQARKALQDALQYRPSKDEEKEIRDLMARLG